MGNNTIESYKSIVKYPKTPPELILSRLVLTQVPSALNLNCKQDPSAVACDMQYLDLELSRLSEVSFFNGVVNVIFQQNQFFYWGLRWFARVVDGQKPHKSKNGSQEILPECLDIPNRPLATEMQPLEISDFSKNPDLPSEFFVEIQDFGQKVSQAPELS